MVLPIHLVPSVAPHKWYKFIEQERLDLICRIESHTHTHNGKMSYSGFVIAHIINSSILAENITSIQNGYIKKRLEGIGGHVDICSGETVCAIHSRIDSSHVGNPTFRQIRDTGVEQATSESRLAVLKGLGEGGGLNAMQEVTGKQGAGTAMMRHTALNES